MDKKLPNSLKKYIRKEKSRIRREFSNTKKQEEIIKQLYEKLFGETNKTRETGV